MGDLRPIGSEKLQGMDKINRILEISRYKENIPKPINEDKSIEYSKTLSDNNQYHIVKEKGGYVIKKTLNESSETDYIEPLKNRKFYSSYSQAFKRLNLIAKEVNVNEGFGGNISLFESDENPATKYILKFGETKEQAPAPAPAPAPAAPAPAAPTPAAPAPEEPVAPPVEDDDEMNIDTEEKPEEGEEEVVTYKTIQKLTGKLAQKIRTLNSESDEEEAMSSKDIKYVINSILSALNLETLEEEDKEDIMNKLEGVEEDETEGGEEMGAEDIDLGDEVPSETPEIPAEVQENEEDTEFEVRNSIEDMFNELEEGHEEGHEDEEYPRHRKMKGMNPRRIQKMEEMIEGIFTESKVDNVIKKYFKIEEKERQLLENKKRQQNLIKESIQKKDDKIKMVSESSEQEIVSRKLIRKYPNAKIVGKTTNKSLVFEMNNNKYRVTINGEII